MKNFTGGAVVGFATCFFAMAFGIGKMLQHKNIYLNRNDKYWSASQRARFGNPLVDTTGWVPADHKSTAVVHKSMSA